MTPAAAAAQPIRRRRLARGDDGLSVVTPAPYRSNLELRLRQWLGAGKVFPRL